MRQKLLLLRLAFKLAIMFLKDFYIESKKEIEDKTLYPQSKYGSCLERSTAILSEALRRPIYYYALAIADHRLCSHGEDTFPEIKKLEMDMTNSEKKSAARGWWLR